MGAIQLLSQLPRPYLLLWPNLTCLLPLQPSSLGLVATARVTEPGWLELDWGVLTLVHGEPSQVARLPRIGGMLPGGGSCGCGKSPLGIPILLADGPR